MPEPKARVLFVEDDLTLSFVVLRHLRARGHEGRTVDRVEDAIDLLASGFRPTVVLLDINLPGAPGWDLLRSDAFRQAGSPPVCVVTATSVSPARLREFGIAGFLPKPFPMATLIDIVERQPGSDPQSAETVLDGRAFEPEVRS